MAGRAPHRSTHPDRFFIGGEWVAPSSDATIDVIDSGTEELYYSVAGGAGRRHGPRGRRGAARVRRGPVAAPDPRRAGRVPARARRRAHGARRRARPSCGRASRARSTSVAVLRDDRRRARSSRTPRWPTRSRSRRSAQPSMRRRVRPARARAGRRRRRDHPVERAARAHLPQDRARAARRVHGRAQVVARGAGRGLRVRRGRGADRAAARRAQRRHRRPRGVGAARPRPARRQDHLHRVDRRRSQDRVAVRRAHRPLHARARRQVGRGDPRRHRPRDRRGDARRRRVRHDRAGVLVAHAHRRDQARVTTSWSRRSPRPSRRCASATRSTSRRRWGRSPCERQRDRVEGYIAKGVDEGATLATGGGRPKDLDRGWFVEPTVFGNVDNASTIAQEEIFGPVLSVIPADDEQDAVRIANDTIYGLNASVFTNDVDRARAGRRPAALRHRRPQRVPHRLRHGVRRVQAVGHRPRRRQGRAAARSSRPRPSSSTPRRAGTRRVEPAHGVKAHGVKRWPAFTSSTAPVMPEARSDARNSTAFATSSLVTIRRSAISFVYSASTVS